MYRLYDMDKRELITANESKDFIYNTIINWHKENHNLNLYLLDRKKDGDVPIISIRNEKDLEFYKKFYEYNKLTGKSCIELRREILELTEKQKIKSLGTRV